MLKDFLMNAPATPVTTKRGRLRAPLIVLLCLITVLGSYPDLAEARAGGGGSRGGGSSMGSRGSRTYQSSPSNSPYQAKPIERSATPASNPAAATPGAAPQPVAPQRPSFFGSNPFLSSLAGGFIGAGLFGMLFGGGGIGGMGSPMGAALGGFLQIALLVGLGLMAYRWFKRSNSMASTSTADGYGYSYGTTAPAAANSFGGSNFASVSGSAGLANNDSPLTLNDSDLQAFEALLGKIQHSWSQADMGQMRAQTTPEILHYFNEILAGNTSRGEANHVEQVTLLAGNPIESWMEGEFDYATVHMKWRALDYTTRLDRKQGDADYVVSGSMTVPSEAEEIWTFVRTNGGNWILSAIQQVA